MSEGLSRLSSPVKSATKASKAKSSAKEEAPGAWGFASALSAIILLVALAIGFFLLAKTGADFKAGQASVKEAFKAAREGLDDLYSLSKGYLDSLDMLKRAAEEWQNVFGRTGGKIKASPVEPAEGVHHQ